jgi:hypothetical protein
MFFVEPRPGRWWRERSALLRLPCPPLPLTRFPRVAFTRLVFNFYDNKKRDSLLTSLKRASVSISVVSMPN